MSKQERSKRAETVQRVQLVRILESRTFCQWQGNELDVKHMVPDQFDAWASSFVDEFVGVDRGEWDVFDRWRFINTLLGETILVVNERENGTILLIETEVFSSAPEVDEPASQAS